MGKKIMGFILLAALTFGGALTAQAETSYGGDDWKVTFTSGNTLESSFKTADVNDAVYGLQPGDNVIISMRLENENEVSTDWYMTNKVLSSLEDSRAGASGGAYTYILTYTDHLGNVEALFSSDTVGGESNGEGGVGLHGATSALEDYFYLDTLERGQSGVVTLEVALDGETQGNGYQNTLADLQMNFAVELGRTAQHINQNVEVTIHEETTQTPPPELEDMGDSDVPLSERTTIVKTGDETELAPFIVAAGASGFLLLLLALFSLEERRRERQKQKVSVRPVAGLLLALCLALAPVHNAEAAGGEYTYTIRFFSGAQGTIDGGEMVSYTARYGERVTFNQSRVELLNGSKYYVKGIRVSGEDGVEAGAASFLVTGDQDYVVAYGILGNAVAYTVDYVDEAGNALAPSETYYGNIGDKPVVAYQYIEGYQPQAYNIGKTLGENAAENVFTFVYRPAPTPDPVVTTTTTVTTITNTTTETAAPAEPGDAEQPAQGQEGQTPEGGAPQGGQEGQEPEGGGGQGAGGQEDQEPQDGQDADGQDGTGGQEEIPDDDTPLDEPQEYLDMDDEKIPLGAFEKVGSIISDFATPIAVMPLAAKVGVGAAAAALVALAAWLLFFRKKEGKKAGRPE